MSRSNCCFLTCIQISQEAGQVVWYSQSLSEFSTVYCDPHSQRLGIVNKAEIDVFLELLLFPWSSGYWQFNIISFCLIYLFRHLTWQILQKSNFDFLLHIFCVLFYCTFFKMSFAQQKFSISKEFNLSIVSFINHAFSFVSKMPSPHIRSPRFPPILSSNKSFTVVHLSVQFSRSVLSDSLWPHESQHLRPPCLSPTPRVPTNSCSMSR